MRKEFKAWVEGLANKYIERLKYWIMTVNGGLGWGCGCYKLSTQVCDDQEFILTYMVSRGRDDPNFPDYESRTLVPFDYLEADNYEEYVEEYNLKLKKALKEKTIKDNEAKLSNLKCQLKGLKEQIKKLEEEE